MSRWLIGSLLLAGAGFVNPAMSWAADDGPAWISDYAAARAAARAAGKPIFLVFRCER